MARMVTVVLLLGLLLLAACGPATEPTPEVVAASDPDPRTELVTEDGLPGEAYAKLTSDGAWCWFADPRAVSHEGEHRRTYAGWVNSEGDVEVAQYDHETGVVRITSVKDELQVDDHASPALLMRPDGRLMVFYSGHRGRWLIYRIASKAEDVTSWGKEYAAGGHTSDATGYTYPNPAMLADEGDRRYLFWRGAGYAPMFSVSQSGMTWTEPRALVGGGGERPYLKLSSDGAGAIHFALTDDPFVVGMNIFNGIFDGDDMFFLVGIDVVDHGRHGGGFALAGAAGDQDQSLGHIGTFNDDGRQVQLTDGAGPVGQDADDGTHRAAEVGHVDPVAAVVIAGHEIEVEIFFE